ncbi:MAG: PSD1 and planctomycete cytochrome C domain-containing protein [Planctomycetaceae bacterium]
MRKTGAFVSGAAILYALTTPLFSDDDLDQDAVVFFEKKIRPVLVEHCYECHSASAEDLGGGLRLDSRSRLRRGGDSGRIIVPGNPNESLLLSALRHDDLKMPPDDKLPDHVIADFAKWIETGAPDPRDAKQHAQESWIDIETARNFWAFRPFSGATGSIDEFVTRKLNANSLQQNPAADKHTLHRRLFFDLTGLPPHPEQVIAFLGDESPDAYEKLVDRLLASPHFGERWGRHWLDLAQYADSLDAERIFPNRGAWRYRDYVIRALNEDKPFDQFVGEQIAGDLLPYTSDAERAEHIVATQFLTLGPMNLVNQFKEQLRMDIVDNQVDKVGRVFLGLTVGCARCHDHKFDPLEQDDYYRLAGIFQNVQVLNGFRGVSGVFSDWLRQPIPELPGERADRERRTELHRQRTAKLEADLAAKKAEAERLTDENKERTTAENPPNNDETITKLTDEVSKLEKELRDHVEANPPRSPAVLAATEPSQPTNSRITIRGNALNLGEEISRGIPRVLTAVGKIPETASGRLELARSLVHHKNPIVPRVFVNRVWHHLFGTGIVRTVDNFGTRGETPSHPELLDALTQRFVSGGWRVKALIREIVLSRTYRLSSENNPSARSIDPDNRLLWRHSPRRLDGESIRDSLLQISGSLTSLACGPTLPPAEWNGGEIGQFDQINNSKGGRPDVLQGRSVFLPVSRAALRFDAGDPLRQFDFPSPNDIVGARQSSTVPTQSLYLMNSPFVSGQARKFAERLLTQESKSDEERISAMYLAAYGRPAQPGEIQQGLRFLNTAAAVTDTVDEINSEEEEEEEESQSVLVRLCHAILISTEFLTHD